MMTGPSIQPERRASSTDIAEIKERLTAGSKRMDDIEDSLAENTRLTESNSDLLREVRDIMASAKAGLRVLGWLGVAVGWMGAMAGAAIGIWKFIAMVKAGGEPPSK